MRLTTQLKAILASLLIVTALLGVSAAPAVAATSCPCVIYVQKYVGHINTMPAKNAGPALRSMHYRESSKPMGINDLVVLQPGFAGAYPDGHIAFLASYSISRGSVRVTLRGANQPHPNGTWTDHDCSNVSLWTFTYSNNWGIRFYRR